MTQQTPPQGKPLPTIAILRQLMTFLRNAAPQEFEAFIRAYELHNDEMRIQCVQSDANEIMTAKGRALHSQFLLSMMEDIVNPKPAKNPTPPTTP